jgi:hypothetical protein
MWFSCKYQKIRNKVEFFFGPYTENKELWKQQNKLRLMRERKEKFSKKILDKMGMKLNLFMTGAAGVEHKKNKASAEE